MELRARGWSILAAAREVGVSRTSGANWARGYNTYRNGQVVGFVAALDRLAVREISTRYLSQDERFQIADLHRAGVSIRGIAAQLDRAPSTISRELRRNAGPGGSYGPFEAHRRAVARRGRDHPRRLETNTELRSLVGELLGAAVEPTADCPPPAGPVPGPAAHAVVPREHLPGDLPAGIHARAASGGAVRAALSASDRT